MRRQDRPARCAAPRSVVTPAASDQSAGRPFRRHRRRAAAAKAPCDISSLDVLVRAGPVRYRRRDRHGRKARRSRRRCRNNRSPRSLCHRPRGRSRGYRRSRMARTAARPSRMSRRRGPTTRWRRGRHASPPAPRPRRFAGAAPGCRARIPSRRGPLAAEGRPFGSGRDAQRNGRGVTRPATTRARPRTARSQGD